MHKRILLVCFLLAIVVGYFYINRNSQNPQPELVVDLEPKQEIEKSSPPYPPSAIRLLRSDLNQKDDLDSLATLLALYRHNNRKYASKPLGSNREFTSVLTQRNEYGLALLPIDHPAINEAGELVDRWGMPIQFHPLSTQQIELRSNGPDRKAYTEDDIIYSPLSEETRPDY